MTCHKYSKHIERWTKRFSKCILSGQHWTSVSVKVNKQLFSYWVKENLMNLRRTTYLNWHIATILLRLYCCRRLSGSKMEISVRLFDCCLATDINQIRFTDAINYNFSFICFQLNRKTIYVYVFTPPHHRIKVCLLPECLFFRFIFCYSHCITLYGQIHKRDNYAPIVSLA